MKIASASIVAVATLVLALISSGPALAAPRGLGLGLHVGYGESKDAESGSALVGAHAEMRPATFLGLVGSISYKLDEEFEIQPRGAQAVTHNVRSIPISLAARLYLPVKGFDPYLTAGAQWRYISYDFGDLEQAVQNFQADDSETAFGWLVGAGLELAASPSVGFFGELRYELIDADRDLGDADLETAKDFDYDQWHVMGGVTFFLNPAE